MVQIHKPREATIVVAASNSLTKSADYVCDGTNDEVEIQAAINALPAGGGTILLLEGIYYISGTPAGPYNSLIVLRDWTTLRGCGWGTSIKLVDGYNGGGAGIISNSDYPTDDRDYCQIRDLKIDGNQANVTTDLKGIFIYRGSHILISNCYFTNMAMDSIHFFAQVYRSIVEGNVVDQGYGGCCVYVDNESSYNTIVDNVFKSNAHGVYFDSAGGDCSYNTVNGNVFDTIGTGVGFIRGSDHNTITGNTFKGCSQGIYNEGAENDEVRPNDYNIISSNIFIGCGYGIHFEVSNQTTANYNLICNNTIYQSTYDGIRLVNAHHNNICGNIITSSSQGTDNTNDGIYLSNSDHNSIRGNTCRKGTLTNKPRYGINISATCDYNVVRENDLYDSGSMGYFNDAGTLTDAWRQHSDLFMDVLAVSATHVRSNEDLSAATPITFTIDAQPDVPRTLSGHFDTHVNITAYTIVITGVDAKGRTVTETFTEAASPWDFETVNAYATITSIIMTARTGTGVGDTMDIGIGSKLGLSNVIYATGDVYKVKRNNANYPAASYTVNATYHTVDVSTGGAIVAGDDFTCIYRSNLNIVS